ncbi:hypothetical protein Tco_1084675 [Tanacetum coccineum]
MIIQGPVESVVPQSRSPTQTHVPDETLYEERGDSVERAATTATSLDAEQGSGNINRTQSTSIPNDPFPKGIGSGGSPRRQDTILGDRPAQTRFERLSKQSNDSPLPRVNTLGSDEGSMTQQELMVFCTTFSKKVESLETDLKQTKQIYGAAYTRLIKKVKKLEKIVKSSQARRRERIVVSDNEDDLEDPSKQARKIIEIDQDPGISLEVSSAEKDVSTAELVSTAGAVVTTASVDVSTVIPTRNTGVSTANDITMAETMVYIRKSVVKYKGKLVYIRKSAVKDKGKGKMAESKTVQTKTKLQQEQERLNFEAAMRLQAELEEENRQRIIMVHEAASSFNVEEWEDIQARVEANEELVQRAYQPEKELRGYSFNEIKALFETTMRKVNTFVPIESEVDRAVLELAARSSKRAAEEELNQESFKRQKTSESSKLAEEPRDKEADELSQEELQQMMIIVPEQGMNVEALQTKYPIIDWEIYTEGTRKYWKIIRVGNHTEVHHFFDDMLKAFDRDDLVELKRLFEPDTDDELWKLQKHIHDLTWKLYDSCGVHHVSTEKGIDIYMLVEKEYPLSRGTLTLMLVAKLLVDQDNEMSRELLRKIFMQVERPRR